MIKTFNNKLLFFNSCKLCLTIFLISFNTIVFSQTVLRSTYSSFSSVNVNDSLKIAAGQIMNTESNSPKILHGYYPINHSLLNISENLKSEFLVFPNPFSELLNINTNSNLNQEISAQIFSINGTLVLSEKFNSKSVSINTNQLSNGIYFIKLLDKNGLVLIQKLVKH